MEGRGSRRNASRRERASRQVQETIARDAGNTETRGSKRLEKLEVAQEASVYEELDEKEYTELVKRRRENEAGFVVAENGEDEEDECAGYLDMGEEDDWGAPSRSHPPESIGSMKNRPNQPASSRPLKRQKAEGQESEPASSTIHTLFAKQASEPQSKRSISSSKPKNASVFAKGSGNSGEQSRVPDKVKSTFDAGGIDSLVDNIAKDLDDETPAKPRRLSFKSPATTGGEGGSKKGKECNAHMAQVKEEDDEPDDKENIAPKEAGFVEPALPLDFEQADDIGNADGQVKAEANEAMQVDDACEDQGKHDIAPVSEKKPKEEDEGALFAEHRSRKEDMECEGDQGRFDNAIAAAMEEDEEEDHDDIPVAKEGTEEGAERFYMLDASEASGKVFLFGRTHDGNGGTQSACIAVKDVPKVTYAVPKPHVFDDESGELEQMEREKGQGSPELKKELQRRAEPMKQELRAHLDSLGIVANKRKIVPVKQSYFLQRSDIPRGAQWVLEIRYWCPDGAGRANHHAWNVADMEGQHTAALLGGTASATETLILERSIQGPSWLTVKAEEVEGSSKVSWCKRELHVHGLQHISPVPETEAPPMPRLCAVGISIKAFTNPETGSDEVAAITLLQAPRVRADNPGEAWNKGLRVVTAIRQLPGHTFPPGWEQEAQRHCAKTGSHRSSVASHKTEHSLLAHVLDAVNTLDPDVLIGHGLGQDLHLLLHRMDKCKAPRWSRLGRLRRERMPRLGEGAAKAGGGASFGVQQSVAGRLLADSLVSSRELFVNEQDYSLGFLASEKLGETRSDVPPENVPQCFESAQGLVKLKGANENDALLAMKLELGDQLAALALSKQLSNLAGCLWSTVLAGQRSHRVESLLLHEFSKKQFICPNKVERKRDKDSSKEQGKRNQPNYAGGLVLEPKKGLYDKYVVVLDFVSLYPSLLQEYNICFTTVDHPKESEMPRVPEPPKSENDLGVVPSAVKRLVQGRQRLKETIKKETDESKKQQLKVREKALKLLANSVYGCLGFEGNRFHARALAELVTAQGREVLQGAVESARSLGAEVIYGDTDSIMVSTGKSDIREALQEADKVKQSINRRYRSLSIERENVFQVLLLLKKKKYAAMKLEGMDKGKEPHEAKLQEELKGIDLVRRDWSEIAKETGRKALSEILSGQRPEAALAAIRDLLADTADSIQKQPLSKLAIRKQLTRQLNQYSASSSDPHVAVARRRLSQGYHECVNPGEMVPYIVCLPRDQNLTDRCYHPDEVVESNGEVQPDFAYYLESQIFPLVRRLCDPLPGADPASLAECLGLDPARFVQPGNRGDDEMAPSNVAAERVDSEFPTFDDEAKYSQCDPLVVSLPDGQRQPLARGQQCQEGEVMASTALDMNVVSHRALATQARRKAHKAIVDFYNGRARVQEGGDAEGQQAERLETRNVAVAWLSGEDGGYRREPSAMHLCLSHMLLRRQLDCSDKQAHNRDRLRHAREGSVEPLLRDYSAFRYVSSLALWTS